MVKAAQYIPICTIDYDCKDGFETFGSKINDRFGALCFQPLDPFCKVRPLTVGLRGERTEFLNGIPTINFDSL